MYGFKTNFLLKKFFPVVESTLAVSILVTFVSGKVILWKEKFKPFASEERVKKVKNKIT